MLLKRSFILLSHFPRQQTLSRGTKFYFASSKNYYQVLGIPQSASPAEIKSAYYKLAKQYHPDVTKGADDKFKEISSAYETLSDDMKRRNYDDTLKYGESPFGGFSGQSQGRSYTGRPSYNDYNAGYTRQSQSQGYRDDYESYHYGGGRQNKANRSWEDFDPYHSNFRRKFYEDFAAKTGQDYSKYAEAEVERMRKMEQEMGQMMEEALASLKRKLIKFIIICMAFVFLMSALSRRKPMKDYVVIDKKTGSVYVTDKKTYEQWEKSFQRDQHPFEKDPRFVRQDVPLNQMPLQNTPPGWEDRIRHERFVAGPPSPRPDNKQL